MPFIMWKNIAEQGRPQMTVRRMRSACWITKTTQHTHTHTHTHTPHRICDTYCSPTAKMAAWTRLSIMLHVHCLSVFLHLQPPIICFPAAKMMFHSGTVWTKQKAKWGEVPEHRYRHQTLLDTVEQYFNIQGPSQNAQKLCEVHTNCEQ